MLEIIGAVLGFVYRDEAVNFVEIGLTSTLSQYNGTTPAELGITEAWDFVQTTVSFCCLSVIFDTLRYYFRVLIS